MSVVIKFGGTSVLRNPENILKVVNKESNKNIKIVIVLSAFSGVTNLLEKLLNNLDNEIVMTRSDSDRQKLNENLKIKNKNSEIEIFEEIRLIHEKFIIMNFDCVEIKDILKTLLEDIYKKLKNCYINLKNITNKRQRRCNLLCYGEMISVLIYQHFFFERNLKCFSINSNQFLITTSEYDESFPLFDLTRKEIKDKLVPLMSENILLTTGFIGRAIDNNFTLLGRGGSDFTATIIGSSLDSERVMIYTDVNGIFTCDPRKNEKAKTLDELDYKTVSELSYYGAKIIHPKTLIPIIKKRIPVYVKSTFDLDLNGTKIVDEVKNNNRNIDAITSITDNRLVIVKGLNMQGKYGISGEIFNKLGNLGISTPFITQSSSEERICFAIKDEYCHNIKEELIKSFQNELEQKKIDKIMISEPIAIITIVGRNMRNKCGIAGDIFTTLGKELINILAISQGSSEISISVVIKREFEKKALNILHDLI